ncbi:uncharacterized protein PV09_09141 [Verruconis gallopava]|uniref:Amine oxidase n=1 Tax=Verruconis gallopava TaxID=253628 RepID=A0A0D2AJS0_9PEZI|nr:uncharacterized protein PV09_09141 [Verruconis gallopava]KIV99188.1 hypothetical protein PV09_09141 [Verruconis gallopava]
MERRRKKGRVTLDAEVIVVGAGLSGLSSAVTLHEAGAKVIVLEARDRVGGKTWSRELAGGIVDMGAAWINDTNQSRMYELARRFGLDTIVQNVKGNIILHDLDSKSHTFPYGSVPLHEVEPGGVKNMLHIRDTFEALCQKVPINDPLGWSRAVAVDYDDMSMEDFVRHYGGKETALRTVAVWTRAMLGLEPREVSSLYFLAYCKSGGGIMRMRSDERDGGQFLRLAGGTQSFSKSMAASLPQGSVHLNNPVVSIDDDGSVVTVITSRRTFTAKHVIVSTPTVLYKSIMFQPPLHPIKNKIVNSTVHGHLSKVFLAYERPWWRDCNSCGLTQSLKGLISVTRDTSNDEAGMYSLLGFIAGDAGRAWAKLSAEKRRQAVLEHFKSVFAGVAESVPEPIGYIEQKWWDEPFSQGCPCPAMPPGVMTAARANCTDVLRKKHGRVHFVGTEMSDVWRGYMEGAVRTGERGAREVLAELRFGLDSKL